jgi:hypothetical protein
LGIVLSLFSEFSLIIELNVTWKINFLLCSS